MRKSLSWSKQSWRNGSEQPGDDEDDAHACYQIDLVEDDTPALGTAHPPGLRLSYSQRQSDTRRPLTNDAVQHMAQLLQLFTRLEQELYAAHTQEQQALQAAPPADSTDAGPALPRKPPFAPDETDADVFGPAIMALSQAWQSSGRSHATLVREHWAAQADGAFPRTGQDADAPAPPMLVDPRMAQATQVLQLARAVQALADADLSARFHRRFAFAPGAFTHHAARDGQAVGPLQWQTDGQLLVCVTASPAMTQSWWQLSADGLHITPLSTPLSAAQATGIGASGNARATAHGLTLQGNDDGDLLGLAMSSRASDGCTQSSCSISASTRTPSTYGCSKTWATTSKPASFAALARNTPRSCSSAGSSSMPSSSSISRIAVCAAPSPGSGLPPGSIRVLVPRLRTLSTRPSASRMTTALTRISPLGFALMHQA